MGCLVTWRALQRVLQVGIFQRFTNIAPFLRDLDGSTWVFACVSTFETSHFPLMSNHIIRMAECSTKSLGSYPIIARHPCIPHV